MKFVACAFFTAALGGRASTVAFVLPSSHSSAQRSSGVLLADRTPVNDDRSYGFRSEPGGPLPEGVDATHVESLVARRVEARQTGNYAEADALQRELKRKFNVYMDDGERMWGVGLRRRDDPPPFASSSASAGAGGEGDDRWSQRPDLTADPAAAPSSPIAARRQTRRYRKSDFSRPLSTPSEEASVVRKVEERAAARSRGDYDLADDLRVDLADNHGIAVDDERRLWSAGGKFPGRPDRFLPYSKSSFSDSFGDERLEALIHKAVEERARAKKDRDFDKADVLRTGLRKKYGVAIDDELRQWSRGGRFERGHADLGQLYVQRGGDGVGLDEEVLERIRRMVLERQQAKSTKDFGVADALRDELIEKYDLIFDDKRREWRIDTGEYARVSGSDGGGGDESAAPDPLSHEDVANVQSLIRERTVAKTAKKYNEADALRDELRARFGVVVHDRTMEWRTVPDDADTEAEDPFASEAARSQRSAFAQGQDDEGDEGEGVAAEEEAEVSAGRAAEAKRGVTEDEELDSDLDAEFQDEEEGETVEASAAPAAEELSSMTVKELRERLREAGMPVSGKKSVLVGRLVHQIGA